MAEWLISLISVIVGVAIGIVGTELIQWWKRPILEIDFEEREGCKPYIPDFNDELAQSQGYPQATYRLKCLRLNVHNKGKKPAIDCEAKMELTVEKERQSVYRVTLHWARRDPALYVRVLDNGSKQFETDKIYSPISLNRDDRETLDVFKLEYYSRYKEFEENAFGPSACIESMSPRVIRLERKVDYRVGVTVYASNTVSKCFKFKLSWDGTLEGFDKAFTK